MTGLKLVYLFVFAILTLKNSCSMAQVIKGGYYPSWTTDLPPSSVNTNLFTHIFYAFLSPNGDTFKFVIPDSIGVTLSSLTSTLHSKKPSIKVLFSVGGAESGSSFYARMASSAGTRKNFILSSIEVARKYGFDGIDFDWEYPQNPAEMDNFNSLLYEWRAEVRSEATRTNRAQLMITAATYFAVDFVVSDVYRKYSVNAINDNLDFINAMCYDYYGAWDSTTGNPAALYAPNSKVSTSYGLTSWIQAGLAKKKIVMGMPLFGRTWTLKDANVNGVGAPAVGAGPGSDGAMKYKEVETFNKDNNARVVYSSTTISTYSVAGTSWIGYDDEQSVSVKVNYARDAGIGGYFFWALDGDVNWKLSGKASSLWN